MHRIRRMVFVVVVVLLLLVLMMMLEKAGDEFGQSNAADAWRFGVVDLVGGACAVGIFVPILKRAAFDFHAVRFVGDTGDLGCG